MSVLITDANKRTSLYALRSLGSKEIEVTATEIESVHRPIGFYSKYCKHSIVTPNQGSKMYIPKMVDLAKKHEVLIPISTDSMLPISKNIDKFEKITEVPIPKYKQLVIAQDKNLTLEVAENLGIPCPKTFIPQNLSQLKEVALKLEYPVVVKHRESSGAQGVVYAKSPEDLLSKYNLMHQKQERPLIQEYIKGTGFGAFAIFNKDSKPVATFVHKRLREYPITGGQSTFCESVKEPAILKYGLKILKELNWYGLAMVEFKMDEFGEPKIMEINPRFWGSMPLAIASGVDFPYLLYKLAVDGNIKEVNSYKVGVKTRFVLSDTLACSELLLRRPNKISTLQDFIYPFFDRNVVEGLFVLDDPKPAFQFFANRTLRLFGGNKK
jgi:predicted ATP-grasp superfamily ATP-dependent carboligase